MSLIERNIDAIKRLCNIYAVEKMSVFGSVLTDRFNDDSDIDILVSFDELPVENYAENYLQLQEALKTLLGREIDLVEDKAIRNPIFRRQVDKSKVQIYG